MIMSGIAPNFNSNSNSAHDYSAHDYSRYPKISRSACDPIQARMSGDAPRRVPLSSVHVCAKYDVSMLFHFTAMATFSSIYYLHPVTLTFGPRNKSVRCIFLWYQTTILSTIYFKNNYKR